MKIQQYQWSKENEWNKPLLSEGETGTQLVLLFGSLSAIKEAEPRKQVLEAFPNAIIAGCSTAGEICQANVQDNTLVLTAIEFEKTTVRKSVVSLSDRIDEFEAGSLLAEDLMSEDLKHIFVLSEGLNVNGSALIKGLLRILPEKIAVTGGLSADGDRFSQTMVYWGEEPTANSIVAIGFYGDNLEIGFGSIGGWDPFGPERIITKSDGNILYEVDNRSALDLYKQYLGEHAEGLPATGLLFPLSLRKGKGEMVRTILAINEQEQSMTFAGDVPEGSYARLMKANFDRLIDGATLTAKNTQHTPILSSPELAILISCVGRKLVLKQRVEEEVEAVQDILGENTVMTGFYSYGEISPFASGEGCTLHNQTMTITTLSEK